MINGKSSHPPSPEAADDSLILVSELDCRRDKDKLTISACLYAIARR